MCKRRSENTQRYKLNSTAHIPTASATQRHLPPRCPLSYQDNLIVHIVQGIILFQMSNKHFDGFSQPIISDKIPQCFSM